MRSTNGTHLARLLGDWSSRGSGSAYTRLAEALRLLVLDGRLALDTRLPGERDLAQALGLSRTTVTAAYNGLRAGGFAASRHGSGTWTTLPASRCRDPSAAPWAPIAPDGPDLLDLAHAAPDAPAVAVREAYEAALEQLPHHLPGHGYRLFGLPELRAAVAARFTARGLTTSPEQILVTSGAQHAFSLVLALVVTPGDRVLVEHPTYPNALDGARRAGARFVPVALTDDGWDVDAVSAALRQTAPRLAYLVPDFHNPAGLLATEDERAALARPIARSRTLTVVDETLVDLRLDGPDLPPPMATYLPDDLAVTIGSTSKTFWGGLRVGWVRADRTTIRRLGAVRATVDNASPVLEQLAVAYLLGRSDDVLVTRRRELRDRRDALAAAIAARLPDWSVRIPGGGLVLWCDLGAPVSSALVVTGERHGLRLAAGPRFGLDGAFERRLRLPYTFPVDVLTDAADRLAAAYRSVAEAPAVDRPTVDAFA